MSTSATDHIEVHWRVTGSNTAWSVPKAFALSDEIVVDGLKPDTAYDFEARAVSACGAKSVWVPSGYTTPPVPANNVTLLAVQTQVAQSQADANAANAELANIANDNILSPAEKPTVMRDYSVITTEQSGIDAQATQYGVTTQKSDYDNAISTLTAYLNGLNTPVPWNNKSGDTTITGTTFRGYFNSVYTTRQVLLNAIYQTAKGLADSAQSTASIANTTANTANANTPTVANPQFVLGLAGWSPDAAGWTANSTSATSPNPQIATCAEYYRSGFSGNGGLYNNTVNPCQAGDRFAATGQILANAGTGNAYVGIAWFNSSQSLIISSFGNAITGNASGTSRVVGTAPAGAVYCEAVCAVLNYTGSGAYTFTGVTLTPQPNTVDETPDGPNFGRTLQTYLNGNRAIIDFHDVFHRNQHLGNMPDDPTSSRYAVLAVDGNRRPYIDFTQTNHVGKIIDNMGDGTYARMLASQMTNGQHKLEISGSGHQLGDQRANLPVNAAGVVSNWRNLTISYTATAGSPATATISVSAASIVGILPNANWLSYNASSASVSGTGGTNATYYLYYNDPGMAGGTQTLVATTNGNNAYLLSAVYIGSVAVTFPTSGSGGGGGSGGLCVADGMWIRDGLLAGDAKVGDAFDCIDLPTQAGQHVRALQGVDRGIEECVRMITSDGCALVCSLSTPFDLPDGRQTTAPRMLGEQVITDLGTATVTSLALVGPKPVTRAHLGGVSYAAGADPHRRIYSHNASTSKP